MPKGHETNETFRTLARRLLEQGQAEEEVLAKHGLADKLLEDLAAAVEEFDGSVTQSNEGRRGHVGAVAALQAVSDEVMRLVEMLDGLNRYRFGGKAEMIAAWESARNVVAGPRGVEASVPAEEDVRPAA
jgi:tRNA(Ile2) C34 agmatinyltransferase TiaS